MKKSKLIVCALGLFFPGSGLNCFYLQGWKSFWAWVTTIAFGLRPDEKWDTQFNPGIEDHHRSRSGWPVILTVIFSLVLGAGFMMTFLAVSFEQFFISQLHEAKKLSQ